MNRHLRNSLLALVILGVSSPVWSALKENVIQPKNYYDHAFDNSAFFTMDDSKLKFDKKSYTFTASSKDIELYNPQHHEVKLKKGSFSMKAIMDPTGNSAKGSFSFFSSGSYPGSQFGPGLLFAGKITDVGWSESRGFLEFAISDFSGQVCKVGWCSQGERLWFNTGDHNRNGLNLGLVGKDGKFKSFTQTADGVAIVPVPAAVWLLGSGLLGMAGVARRKPSLV